MEGIGQAEPFRLDKRYQASPSKVKLAVLIDKQVCKLLTESGEAVEKQA
jgi:hypothetical protein